MSFRFPSALYPIANAGTAARDPFLALTESILGAGILFFQLRTKDQPTRECVVTARAVKELAERYGAQLIINDRADIAKLVDAAGVHLGQDDLDPRAAREILGPDKIVGFSTHDRAQLGAAQRLGCLDYVAFGPVFPTGSKAQPEPAQGLEALHEAARLTTLPLVAIGGITAGTISEVIASGADAVAVIGAISQSPDPRRATRELLRRAEEATAIRNRRRS